MDGGGELSEGGGARGEILSAAPSHLDVTPAPHLISARQHAAPSPPSVRRSFGELLVLVVVAAALATAFLAPQPSEVAWRSGAGLGLLLLAGLLTGTHCIAMCGGLALAAGGARPGAPLRRSWRAPLVYGLAKTASYAVLGGLAGAVGGTLAISPAVRGGLAVASGALLVVYGLTTLRHRGGHGTAWAPLAAGGRLLRRAAGSLHGTRRTLLFGAANGLMIACGPLQALYLLALGSGSAAAGAAMLTAFGLGTLPVLLGFTWVAGRVVGRSARLAGPATALLLVALGLLMIDRGLTLGGGTAAAGEARTAAVGAAAAGDCRVVRVEVRADGFHPRRVEVRQGEAVCWVLDVREATACNQRLSAPALGLDLDLSRGERVVRWTPRRAGTVRWSCWMGMLGGRFEVVAGEGPR